MADLEQRAAEYAAKLEQYETYWEFATVSFRDGYRAAIRDAANTARDAEFGLQPATPSGLRSKIVAAIESLVTPQSHL